MPSTLTAPLLCPIAYPVHIRGIHFQPPVSLTWFALGPAWKKMTSRTTNPNGKQASFLSPPPPNKEFT